MARGVFVAGDELLAAELNDCFAPPRCRVKNSAVQSIANSTAVAITWDTETFDVGACHSTSVNTSRLTVPAGGAGLYHIYATGGFAANATGRRDFNLRLNGVTNVGTVRESSPSGTEEARQHIATEWELVAGDYIELVVNQNSGGALNFLAAGELFHLGFRWVAVV